MAGAAGGRSGRAAVGPVAVLRYCGTPAYLRTSKLGIRHFAHRNAGDCPAHPGETGQHLLAKNIILQAAGAAGWDADTEVRGDTWVADVLARNGGRTVAFEVQWSSQTRAELERRQARYAADNVDGVWFTRHERSVPFPHRDLPVFHMLFTDAGPTVVVNEASMAMADAVAALLDGRIAFRDHVATGRPATVHVGCFEYPCYRCGAISLIWDVERETLTGPCGTTVEVTSGTIWAQDRPEASAPVRHRAATEAARVGVPAANLSRRYSRTAGGSYTAFSCPSCDALFGDWHLRSYMIEARTVDAGLVLTLPEGHDHLPAPHWCVDNGSGLCVDHRE